MFIPLLPLVFTSSAFAPVSTAPRLDAADRPGEPGDRRPSTPPGASRSATTPSTGSARCTCPTPPSASGSLGHHHGVVHVPRGTPVSQGLIQPQSARSRVFLALAAGTVAVLAVAWFVPWQLTVLVGWDVDRAHRARPRSGARSALHAPSRPREFALREDDTRAGTAPPAPRRRRWSAWSVWCSPSSRRTSTPGTGGAARGARHRSPSSCSWLARAHRVRAAVRAPLLHGPDGWHRLQDQGPTSAPTTSTSRTPRSPWA